MRCLNHQEVEAVALCRVCSIALCNNCALPAVEGFICSEACRKRAEVIDRMLDVQSATLMARGQVRWFMVPAVLIVFGVLLIGEEAIFGTASGPAKVVIGILLLVMGLGALIHVLYIKKQVGTGHRDER